MRRRTTLAILLAATTLAATAQAAPKIGQPDNGYSLADERYLSLYEKAHKAGYDVGRNLLDWTWSDAEPVSDARIEASSERLDNWLNPPEPAAFVESTSDYATVSTYAPAPTSAGGCPASMAPESGTAGYSAYNPSSGATGCYQIIPSTAAAHNCDLSTPEGQDACAARICATSGNGAWSASGATPC